MLMTENTQTGGLCITCNNSPSCFHLARRGPALFCEMFDDYVAPTSDTGARWPSRAQSSSTIGQTATEDTSHRAGLCMNCEHRRACTHQERAGGVWHCEDYE